MEVYIYQNDKGKVRVNVRGSTKNSAKQVAKAFIEVYEELNKGEKK